MRDNRTCSLGGGRRPARKRASSDPTTGVIHRNSRGLIEACAYGRSAVSAKVPWKAAASHRGDYARSYVHAADPPVVHIGNEQGARIVEGYSHRGIEARLGGRATISAIAHSTASSDRTDDPGRTIHAANALIKSVGDKNIAGAVYCQPVRIIQARFGRRTSVAAEAARAVAGHRSDYTRKHIHSPYAVVQHVRDVDIARAIGHRSIGAIQPAAPGVTAIASESREPIAGNNIQLSAGIYAKNFVLVRARCNVQPAATVTAHANNSR
jgi:hypothetical protein